MIKVNEIFGPTVQGEGKSAGRPVAFLRLALCNLHCIWCDTPHTWNWVGTQFAHPEKFQFENEVHAMTDDEIFDRLTQTGMDALVISGGEPLIQQKQLVPLLRKLKASNWWVEIETNGTIPPREDLVQLIDQINCSPKLSHSLDPLKLRIRETALHALANEPKVNFKFVVRNNEDIDEALGIISQYGLDRREVRLMPECRTKEELLAKELWLQKECAVRGMIYCTRLSILQAGTERGV